MVNVCHSCHGNKWEVVQKPSHCRIHPGVMDMVDLRLTKLGIATLPTHSVPGDQKAEDTQSSCTPPVDKGIPKEVILDRILIPRAHTEANAKDRPLPELRGQIVLFIRIGNKGVVGGHHGDVEMDKVLKER